MVVGVERVSENGCGSTIVVSACDYRKRRLGACVGSGAIFWATQIVGALLLKVGFWIVGFRRKGEVQSTRIQKSKIRLQNDPIVGG
jgi:hypothetical protein